MFAVGRRVAAVRVAEPTAVALDVDGAAGVDHRVERVRAGVVDPAPGGDGDRSDTLNRAVESQRFRPEHVVADSVASGRGQGEELAVRREVDVLD